MVRESVSVVLGFIVGATVVGFLEAVSHWILPTPSGLQYQGTEQLAAIIETAPFLAKLAVPIVWAMAIFGGGATAIYISNGYARPASAVAVLLYLGAVYTMILVPHPVWMIIGTTAMSGASALGVIHLFAQPHKE